MANKQNDWLVASLNNPDFTVSDFKNISELSLDNTQFLNKELYKSSDFVRNQKQFQDENGNFSEKKFDKFYEDAASSFKDFSVENTIDDYQYSMWDPSRPNNGKIKSINFNLETIKNPDHFKVGIEGINATTLSDKTKRELAQDSKIFDPSTGQFLDHSVNDISLFSNPIGYVKSLFEDPLVYATYDQDTVEVDPITGNKVVHKAGEWKVNDDGEYYTEKLNGRNIRDKQVVSTEDYITDENSALNSIDFWDSDDKEKSVTGTIAKNIASVLPMFVPYVGATSKIGGLLKSIPTVYSGLMVGRELAKSLPMAYGMIGALLGDSNPNNKLANTLAAYGQKFSGSSSDYAQENTFAFENFGSLMSDVALQWGQQKFIADAFSKLSSGGETAIKVAQDKAANDYLTQAEKYIQQNFNGKISNAQLASYIGTDKIGNPLEIVQSGKWAETALGKAALNKYLPAAQKIFENRNRMGQDLSLAYMALISNTDVYDSILEHGGTAQEAAAMAFGSTLGMFGVDKYLGLGEIFFQKDPARQAFKKIARENADLYISGRKAATGITDEMSTKTGIVNKIKRGIDLGRKITDDFLGKYKDGTIGLVGKAIGEGTEEMAEELVADLTKNLGELAGKLGYASQTDYGAWDDMANRYAMSFLGGAAGGALFGGVEAWNGRKQNLQEFQTDLTDLIRQGKKNEILEEFKSLRDKGKLGDLNLSYDTTTNSDGDETLLTADDNHLSQAESNYRGLTNIVNQLDMILNDNGLKLDDDEVFDKMVQGEYRAKALTDFLKGKDIDSIKNASYISKYQEDFKKLTDDIINVDQAIQELNKQTTDLDKRKDGSDYQNKLQELQQKKQELLEQKDYLFGEGSLGYVEKTLFAMDTKLSGNFMSLNIHQFAREKTGKSFSDLSKTEQETIQKLYEEYGKTIKPELDEAFNLYKNMEKQLTPELQELSKTDLKADFKELERIRNEVTKLKLLRPNDKLPTESDEDFASLSVKTDTESDAEFEARKLAHRKAIDEYNINETTRWIEEFTKHPITSTDFRFLKSQVGVTKHELLKYFMDNVATTGEDGIKRHWWEMIDKNNNEFVTKHLNDQNKDLYDLVIKTGLDNKTDLKNSITKRIEKTSQRIINDKYNFPVLDSIGEDVVISTLKNIQNLKKIDKEKAKKDENGFIIPDENGKFPYKTISSIELEEYGIPLDYEFDSNKLTYKDLLIYLKAAAYNQDLAPGEFLDSYAWQDFVSSIPVEATDKLKEFEQFAAQSILDPSILNSDLANKIIDATESAQDVEKSELTNEISRAYFTSFDQFANKFEKEPHVKQLNNIAASVFSKNPIIPIINKISSFRSKTPVNLEELLKNVYDIYESKENDSDFQLSNSQVSQLEQVLQDMKTAKVFIKGASTNVDDGNPVGHNKSINEFIKNHSDVFKDAEELTEIDSKDANVYLNEISVYEREINSWLNKHKLNSGAREAKFIKADEALTKTITQFFSLNREGFKIGNVDLLDGYEDLTIENNLSSIVSLQQLLYKNFKKSGLKIEDVLEKMSPSTLDPEQIVKQKTASLNEELTYDKFTQYDKFQLIISSLAVDTVKFYKQLKAFLEGNDNIAPISIQEYVGKLSYAQKENPDLINSALKWIKTKTKSKLDLLENTSVITGLGGSGKTFAAIRLNLGKGENTWVCGPTNSQIDNLKRSLESSTEKSKKDLMDLVLGVPNPKLSDLYTIGKLNGNNFPIINDSVKINKIQNPPKNIVIDEATHFNAAELLLIGKTCKENNIKLFLLGDEHQSGIQTKDGIGNIEDNSIITWRTPDLYISLRNSNQVKVKNQDPLLQIIDKFTEETIDTLGDSVYNNLFKKINLQYYNKDTFSGELITKDLSDEILAKIPKTIDGRNTKIGYIGTADSYYDKLKNLGYDVSEALSPTQVQGQEFDYVVINKDWKLDVSDSNWRNNNIDILNFTKDLYTMITRSTEGTIIIDNGLSDIISCSETDFNGKYNTIQNSVKKFREKHIPEIDKAIADNPEIEIASDTKDDVKNDDSKDDDSKKNDNTSSDVTSTTTTSSDTTSSDSSDDKSKKGTTEISLGDKTFKPEELETEKESQKDEDNSEEVNTSKHDEDDFSIYPTNPITCYSSVSFSGINTKEETWVNDTNSTEDLGIFVAPGESVEKGSKLDKMKLVLQLKNIFQFGYDDWENVPSEIRAKFDTNSIENAKYFIKVEAPSDSNRLIGLTEGLGLTNEGRTYKDKVIKLIAKIKGRDEVEYSVSLGGLNKPSTWKQYKDFLKSVIKEKIDKGTGDIEALQKQYDSYDDSVTKYENLVNSWVTKDQEIELANPPKFGKYTRLEQLSGIYRLEDSISSMSPYNENAPLQVQSEVNIITDKSGLKPDLIGKPVMFVSSNLLLKPAQLKAKYLEQLADPSLPKQVRMIVLSNMGVSFESLYTKKWSEFYNMTVGNRKFTTPMRMLPFGFRMYKSMWNYRADLNRFLDRYTQWCTDNNFNDNDVEELCKKDNKAFSQLKQQLGVETLSEEEYRSRLDPNVAKELKVLWDFNDGIGSYVKELRLGYSSDHGAYLRKLTNIDDKFYSEPNKAVGIYINPKIAKTQQKLLDNIFENVIDKFLPQFNKNKSAFLSLDSNSLETWVKDLQSNQPIKLNFQEENSNEKTEFILESSKELKNKLRALPMTMMKLAHYMNIAMCRNLGEFKESIDNALITDNKPFYEIKIDDQVIDWFKFIDDLDDHVDPSFTGEFKSIAPGIVPWKTNPETKTNIGRFDSRLNDLWNLMFHGVVSTKEENDFTRDFIRATGAEFKYGIFSDPILCEFKKEEKGFSDLTTTSNKFFGTNIATSGPLIQIDFKFKSEEAEKKPKSEIKIEDVVEPTEQEKYHSKIEPILKSHDINIDPKVYDDINEYLERLNKIINTKLDAYLTTNGSEDFNDIIIKANDGGLIYLKDMPEFNGATFVFRTGLNQVEMSDGNKYNITVDAHNNIMVTKVEEPKVVVTDEEKNNQPAMQANDLRTMIIDEVKKQIDDDSYEIFDIESQLQNWEGETFAVPRDGFEKKINDIQESLKDYKDDLEMGDDYNKVIDTLKEIINKLDNLKGSCFI